MVSLICLKLEIFKILGTLFTVSIVKSELISDKNI